MANEDCQHENFDAEVNVARIQKSDADPTIHRWQADITIKCHECGLPFRFIGLPAGLDMNGAAVSVDGAEARLAIAPKGHVLTPLESTDVQGFTVRRTK